MLYNLLPYLLLFPALAMAASHTVEVGKSGNTFEPNFVNAAAGDQIIFNFASSSHDILNSVSFDKPCLEFKSARRARALFHHRQASDFIFITAPAGGGPVTYDVKGSGTVWAHCSKGTHCENGMVFAINPDPAGGEKTIDAFKALAAGGGNTTTLPGTGGSSVVLSATSAAASAAAAPTGTTAATPGAATRTLGYAGLLAGLTGVAWLTGAWVV